MTNGNGKLTVQEKERLLLIRHILDKIDDNSKSISEAISKGVTVKNIDVVKGELANQFRKLNKNLVSLFENINLSKTSHKELLGDVKGILKELRGQNKHDDFKISNFKEIEPFFNKLAQVFQKIDFSPKIDVQPADVNIPETKIPEVDLKPTNERLKKLGQQLKPLQNNSPTKPLAVRISDGTKFIDQLKSIADSTSSTLLDASHAFASFPGDMKLRDKKGQIINPATQELQKAGRLVNEQYDFIDLDYTGSNLTTVTYKIGGSGGETVATLTLTYSGDNLDTITKA